MSHHSNHVRWNGGADGNREETVAVVAVMATVVGSGLLTAEIWIDNRADDIASTSISMPCAFLSITCKAIKIPLTHLYI